MLARHTTHRIFHSLHLDFLPPALLRRNQSSSLPLRSYQHSKKSAQSHSPSTLATQISQTLHLLTQHEGVIPPNHEIDLFNKTITDIRESLLKHDIPSLWISWSLLRDKNMLQFLGLPQLETYSRHIASIYNLHPTAKKWDVSDIKAMQDIALFTAAGGHPEALNAIMISLIKAGKPNDVLDLYGEYATSSSNSEPDNASSELGYLEDGEYGFPLDSPLQYSLGKTEILLSAITACAMLDSFHKAVRITLSANTHLNNITVRRVVPTLPNHEKVFDYVKRLGMVRVLGCPPVFAKYLANLVRDRHDLQLEKLYESIIDGVLGPEPWLAAVAGQSDGSPRPVVMPDFTWTSLITAFMTCRRPDLTEKLWDDMVRCGVKPQVAAWTAIFDGYNTLGAVQESFGTWEAMIAQGIKPEPLTYRAIIATLFNCRRPRDAMEKFREYERDWSSKRKASPGSPDEMGSQILALHNTVLHGLFTNTNREHEALAFFKKMQTQGPRPDIVSWNTLMGYYSRRGDLKMLASALQNLRQTGLSGDVFTYSIILSALLKAGREDAPELITGLMKKHGIERNATVNTAIIDQILQTPDGKRLKAAFSILTRMESEESAKAQPNEITYTTILAGIYRGSWHSREEIETYRRDILRRMRNRDVRPNRVTYHILMKACFESPNLDGHRYALDHYDGMLRQKIPPNFDTWYILLGGLLKKGQMQIANEMADEMVKKWYEPSGALVGLVNRIRDNRTHIRR